jgi:hypothetical protein
VLLAVYTYMHQDAATAVRMLACLRLSTLLPHRVPFETFYGGLLLMATCRLRYLTLSIRSSATRSAADWTVAAFIEAWFTTTMLSGGASHVLPADSTAHTAQRDLTTQRGSLLSGWTAASITWRPLQPLHRVPDAAAVPDAVPVNVLGLRFSSAGGTLLETQSDPQQTPGGLLRGCEGTPGFLLTARALHGVDRLAVTITGALYLHRTIFSPLFAWRSWVVASSILRFLSLSAGNSRSQ